ncbi:Macrolide export protein MacA [Sporotomaculum syntrophicum]|uniref:Macrolide export protein MacA n=1 Tax=Sporotomaculum syntrophicum TaxID=182264 RepID=A0A9D3AZ63_9FIRM|nr:efflux RND transporter periplasmic adaptor subunit [Sporotomaculum syntrophicum]KAF1085559.1 Macrolide export protein MacA [Sporotomaculum syntrophicum]
MKPVAKYGKRLFLLSVFLVILALAAMYMIKNSGIEAETVRVRTGDIIKAIEDTGYVQPATKYDLQAAQNAKIIQVPVANGQRVAKGQTLVIMENLDLSLQITDTRTQLSQSAASLAAAKAAVDRTRLELKNAEDNLERSQQLFDAGAMPVVDLEAARLKAETLEQALKEQELLLDSTREKEEGLNRSLQNLNRKEMQLVLQSPVDGEILNLPAEQEQVVNPGTLLVSVAVAGKLEIKADILSDDLGEVSLGQPVKVTAPVLGTRVLTGKVMEIYPQAEEKQSALGVIQRRVPVIIALDDFANLKPGYEVKVAIETSARQGVPVIPRETVRTLKDGGKQVMVVKDNRILYRTVQTGIGDRESVEITKGLQAGEMLIRDGSLDLKPNARFKGSI